MKIQKINGGGGVRRVDVFEELKFLGKFTKKKKKFWGGGGVRLEGGGFGRGGGGVGLGGQGGCVRRIEVFVKIQIKKKNWWGGEGGGRGGCERRLKFL